MGPIAFRAKFNITVAKKSDRVTVVIAKGMIGWGGGLLNVGRVNKEAQGVVAGIQEAVLS